MKLNDDGTISGRDVDLRFFRPPTRRDLKSLQPVKATAGNVTVARQTKDYILTQRQKERRGKGVAVPEKVAVPLRRRSVVPTTSAPRKNNAAAADGWPDVAFVDTAFSLGV